MTTCSLLASSLCFLLPSLHAGLPGPTYFGMQCFKRLKLLPCAQHVRQVSHFPLADVGEKRVASKDRTIDLHFPWSMSPYKNFPTSLRPIRLSGCGRISKRLATSLVSYYSSMYTREAFSRAKFADEAAASVVAFTNSVEKMDPAALAKCCHGQIRKIVYAYMSVAKSRGLDFQIKLNNLTNFKIAGGAVLFFYRRVGQKTLAEEGLYTALHKSPVMYNPVFSFIHHIGDSVEIKSGKPMSVLLRLYASFSTQEVYSISERGKLLHGSLEPKDSAHVVTLERIVCCQKPEEDGFFETEGWYITDIDTTLLRMQQSARKFSSPNYTWREKSSPSKPSPPSSS